MLNKELLESTLTDIESLRESLFTARNDLEEKHPNYESLLNLKHYILLRSKNRTDLQEKLFTLSLSSLGRSYAHVAASIDTLYDQLRSSLNLKQISFEEAESFHHLSIQEAVSKASKNSKQLFGGTASSKLSKQTTSVMVTLPSNAADDDGKVILELANAGVNIFRINTAHDNIEVWQAMAKIIKNINEQREERDKIKIFVDLAGPKIRTQKIRKIDMPISIGSNKVSKEVVIVCGNGETKPKSVDIKTLENIPAQICVNEELYKKISKGRVVKIVDVNNKKATINITHEDEKSLRGVINKKVFLSKSSSIRCKKVTGVIKNIYAQVEPIRLFIDDELVITQKDIEGRTTFVDKQNNIKPALISCSFKEIVKSVNIDDKIFIDDGKIGLVVTGIDEDDILCKVINAKANGTLLKEEKGINLPDSYINTSAITQTDIENVLSVLDFADHFSISFCQSEKDVEALQEVLRNNKKTDVGIIAKIETKQALSNMPKILEKLLEWEKSGVMIARGDLAIEVGFSKMAYVQEALLDICDAAHIPVIWATQVLESQMKNNLPSRAEITDAAMSGRAECVMLNKGPFAVDTIEVLSQILDDMHSIFKKNKQLLKKETLW